MEEFLLQILAALAEPLIEILGAAILDLVLRGTTHTFESRESVSPAVAALGYVVLGTMAGVGSLMVFPHPLVAPSRFHGISLLISPLVTGFAMSLVGMAMRRIGIDVTRIESFGYGAAFAFGVALMRLLFAT